MITKDMLKEIPKHKQLFFIQKFYAEKNNFQNFHFITNERKIYIENLAKEFKIENNNLSKKGLYVLSFISLREMDLTYDEKIIWLIKVNDENLMSLTIYEKYKDNLEQIQKKCLEAFGFYSTQLIEFQQIYYQEFYQKSSLKEDYQKLVNVLSNLLTEKKERIRATSYYQKTSNKKDLLLNNAPDHKEYELRLEKRKKEYHKKI